MNEMLPRMRWIMISEIDYEHLDRISTLLQQYLDHIGEASQTLIGLRDQYAAGQKKGYYIILVSSGPENDTRGFLIYNLKTNRIPIIFANQDFEVEREVFDEVLERFDSKIASIVFESGYPTPWISHYLIDYAIKKGFTRHDRGYMRLEPIAIDHFATSDISDAPEFLSFTESIITVIAELLLKSVDGTIDQAIFPSIYRSSLSIETFLRDMLSGQYGTHKEHHSWVLRYESKFIGACFMIVNDDTGFLVQIAIDPSYRRKGFGRILLIHSILNLLTSDKGIKRIELAVTWENPARKLYESLGFKVVNRSSTFVWND
jgi:ribosomal protein S18 acetylase RimI-like enzyme